MKKLLIILILGVFVSIHLSAQNAEKVKGNRNVTLLQTYVTPFHTILVDEDFEIDLIYNKEPSVEIETDENLHEFILFEVRDSILSFNKTRKITSKKKLHIKVNFDDLLANIETRDAAKIHSLTTLEFTDASLKTSGTSKAGLTIKANHFSFEGLDKSKNKLNLTCENSNIILNGLSKLEALINSPISKIDLYQRAEAVIEGSSNTFDLRMDNNSSFMGKNFTVETCNLICEIGSDATLEVTDNITLAASGESSVYLYSNPKITIEKLEDTSKIQKKVK